MSDILVATMPKPDYSDWLTKAEAAGVLQCAEKTIERLAQRGKIQQASRPVPGRRPVAVFHPGDVEKLKNDGEATQTFPMPAEDTASPGTAIALRKERTPTPAAFLEALAAAMPHSRVTPDKKLYLTIREAAEYSGLPMSHLKELMKDGKLEALKLGAGWRIKRTNLERL